MLLPSRFDQGHRLTVAQGFVGAHIAAIVATSWVLMLNGAVGYQLLDDGTAVSVGLLLVSSLLIFIGTGYIALDTGFSWTGYWDDTLPAPNKAYALYTLYQLVPLIFLVIFFLLESFLVLRILGERKPMRRYSANNVVVTVTDMLAQSICSVQQSSLPLAKYSSMSPACTSAIVQVERSMEVYSRPSSHCSQWSWCGYSGRALPKTTGLCPRPVRARTTDGMAGHVEDVQEIGCNVS